MDKEDILKNLNEIQDEIEKIRETTFIIWHDLFSLIEDIELYLVDAES